jgi:proteasome assembly chaperone (PAC2) family protein
VTDPFVRHEHRAFQSPVLVTALAGWIDAGAAAGAAMAVLEAELGATPFVTFDPDTFIDYRARRPVLQLRDGVNTELLWPEIHVLAARAGRQDVLLLSGHEPDSAWRLFCEAVATLAGEAGVRMMVGMGAYPFATPHSRPSRLSITASTPELAQSLPYGRNSVDVPAGIEAALERRFADLGVPAVGLWAQVPHYVANFPYPAASVALLSGLAELTGITTEAASLRGEAMTHRRRLDELVANSEDHVALVRQLEAAYDAETGEPGATTAFGPLPSGDELAAELERFLRDQG